MNILIVNAYTRCNGGDAAILSVLIRQIREAWPKAKIVIASMEDPATYPEFEKCKNIGSIRYYNAAEQSVKIVRMYHKAIALLVEAFWSYLSKSIRNRLLVILPVLVREELAAIDNAHLVISLGGGYLNGSDNLAGNLNVRYILLPIKLAEQFHKPVIMAPQSFGPFGNAYQIKVVKQALNDAKIVMVREDKSLEVLDTIGIHKKRIVRTIDAGFAFDTKTKAKPHSRSMRIGITARAWLPSKSQNSYELAIAHFIDFADKKYHAKVDLIPQVTSELYQDDDRIVERKIADLVSKNVMVNQIDERPSHHELKRYYNNLDFTIGTRFHSVIFSLTSYVPAIAIEYEHKTSGIMQDLGLDKWVINIEDVTTERLSTMFKQLVREREAYIAKLHAVLPAYIAKAEETGQIMKQVYEQSVDLA